MGEIGDERRSGILAWEAQPPGVVSTKGSGPRHPVPGEGPGALSCFPLSIFAFTNTLQVQRYALSQGEEGTARSLGSGSTSSSGCCSAFLSPRSLSSCVCLLLPSLPPSRQSTEGAFRHQLPGGQREKAHSVTQGQATASSLWLCGTGLGI